MASETTNYQLVKPDPEEFYDVMVPNKNMDKIDAALNALSEALGGIDLATLSQAISDVDSRVTTHLAENNSSAHKAKSIVLDDVAGVFAADNVEDGMKELFTNVSNGKNLVGTAITDVDAKVAVPTNPTFNDLASAIGNISTGKKWASGTANVTSAQRTYFPGYGASVNLNFITFSISSLGFTPSIILVNRLRQVSIMLDKNLQHDSNNNLKILLATYNDGSNINAELVLKVDGVFVGDNIYFPVQAPGTCSYTLIE